MEDRKKVYRMLNATLVDTTRRFYTCKNLLQKSRIMKHIAQLNTAIETFGTDAHEMDSTYETA